MTPRMRKAIPLIDGLRAVDRVDAGPADETAEATGYDDGEGMRG